MVQPGPLKERAVKERAVKEKSMRAVAWRRKIDDTHLHVHMHI